ncbi:hypothetical protein BP5796_04001 [Coleophoma crateriformis]|uniref:Uncharacterized protein n=1 Tax=Coleophoma crateriformis TaxID=565419 RepID=A0A3D8SH90_9HELO|nr:hypothetical protein BP5796_04001 [Coleophoma crateriformis]
MSSTVSNEPPDEQTAQLYQTLLDKAREYYDAGNFNECREQCFRILDHTELPRYTCIDTLHLLATVSYFNAAVEYLELAAALINEADKVATSDMGQLLRQDNLDLTVAFERQKQVRMEAQKKKMSAGEGEQKGQEAQAAPSGSQGTDSAAGDDSQKIVEGGASAGEVGDDSGRWMLGLGSLKSDR